ncbi:TetR family transcriptional regulator [Kribbella qitaiheensis]|uniref:TetR family transcriptional regulator n=1 Tax=Kribbella qitaiheensis TaxID=1544730 RepID=A0A7G6X367_9ACTN|nr:TetR/AcrR family transcriptional regulator [Kribbella qitaiheensis]QNE20682.1 TetR family transcriptional regulator [Kribbella qitaiheensis]
MVRWEPGAQDRLRQAALELYLKQGFEQTTVGEIARSVGLTERTYFRHFADKREVLFDGQDTLQQAFVDSVTAAPQDASPVELVAAALAASAEFFPAERRQWSRQRQEVIVANPPLQERELLKMARLTAAFTKALRARGVPEPHATLAAESGTTVFTVAFLQWIADGETRSLADVETEVLAELGTFAEQLSGHGSDRKAARRRSPAAPTRRSRE